MSGESVPFLVEIAAHEIAPRFSLPASSRVVYVTTERLARAEGIRRAHRDGEIPALRSLLRQSWPYSTAERTVELAEGYRPTPASAA